MSPFSKREAQLDVASFVTLFCTVVLFFIALFEKGFTHDILLETGVFLVSVKLVLATHKIYLSNKAIEHKLDEVLRAAEKKAA